MLFVFKLQHNKKIDFVKNWICVKIPVFPIVFIYIKFFLII